jgi:hypothetical protein
MNRNDALRMMAQGFSKWAGLDLDRVKFADDADVEYHGSDVIRVPRDKLLDMFEDSAWEAYLGGENEWVHANLMFTRSGQQVVSLRRGPDAASPIRVLEGGIDKNLNVSMQRLPLEIVDDVSRGRPGFRQRAAGQ